jgi:hypothetical protein
VGGGGTGVVIDPVRIAGSYALLEEKDRAFSLLEKAAEEKSGSLGYINSFPSFDSLRSVPCDADLLKRMGLPP